MTLPECQHVNIDAKYIYVNHYWGEKKIVIKVFSWFCQECGTHGVETELCPMK